MKNLVTDFEGENEPVAFNNNILGNSSTKYFLGISTHKCHLF